MEKPREPGDVYDYAYALMNSVKRLDESEVMSASDNELILRFLGRVLPTPGSDFFNICETMIQNDIEGLLSFPLTPVMLLGAVLLTQNGLSSTTPLTIPSLWGDHSKTVSEAS